MKNLSLLEFTLDRWPPFHIRKRKHEVQYTVLHDGSMRKRKKYNAVPLCRRPGKERRNYTVRVSWLNYATGIFWIGRLRNELPVRLSINPVRQLGVIGYKQPVSWSPELSIMQPSPLLPCVTSFSLIPLIPVILIIKFFIFVFFDLFFLLLLFFFSTSPLLAHSLSQNFVFVFICSRRI